jgi:hypothetical protein
MILKAFKVKLQTIEPLNKYCSLPIFIDRGGWKLEPKIIICLMRKSQWEPWKKQ